MVNTRHYIIIGNKKYEYFLEPARSYTKLICKDAGIERRFHNNEIPAVLVDLPNLIISIIEDNSQQEVQSEALRFRVTPSEKDKIMQDAILAGYDNMSAYLRAKVLGG
jgi:hypothetical protein